MIKVSFSGQYLGRSGYITSFQDTEDASWTSTLFDPRSYGRDFFKDGVEECFSIWQDQNAGNNYALLKKSPDLSTRDGYVMIVICTGSSIIEDGYIVIDRLRRLYDLFCNNKYSSVQKLKEECTDKVKDLTIDIPLLESKTYSKDDNHRNAIRYYDSEKSLAIILENPNQRKYESFEHIFILPSSAEFNKKDDYEEITSDIKKCYYISKPFPYGVSPDKDIVEDGDILTITYSKKGYLENRKNVTIDGNSNSFFNYHDREIRLNDISLSGVNLKKTIKLLCRSKNGASIKDVYVIDDGYTKIIKGETLVLEQDLDKYEFIFTAKGYENLKETIETSDFNLGRKTLTFTPQTNIITIYIDNKNETLSGKVSIETDSPIYEILNDACIHQTPINKLKFPKSSKQNKSKGWKEKVLRYIKKIKLPITILALGYVLYALFCVLDLETLWPFGSKPDQPKCYCQHQNCDRNNCLRNQEDKCTCDYCYQEDKQKNKCFHDGCTSTDCMKNEECVCNCENCNKQNDYEETQLELGEKDILYLKRQDNWVKDSIKSNKYLALFEYIQTGEIDSIIQSQWFNNQYQQNVNSLWHKISDETGIETSLRKIANSNDSMIEERAKEIMKELSSNGVVNLRTLRDNLSSIFRPQNPSNSKAAKIDGDNNQAPSKSGRQQSH